VALDPDEATRQGRPYGEVLRDLANAAARHRGGSEDGTLADLLAVFAAREMNLLQPLQDQLADPADRRALDAVLASFERDDEAFREKLLRRYPGLFHSQGAD
jgi:hypothetical protein